jgi:DNA-binding CsgD family transcriptional regulator
MESRNNLNVVHDSNWLKVSYDSVQSLFIQKWKLNESLTIDQFKIEMLAYTAKYIELKPSFSLWHQLNFTLNLTSDDFMWLEEFVNIPCKEAGNIRCAFLVGSDVLAHISVLDSFEQVESCIEVKHFCEIENAVSWLFEGEKDNTELSRDNLSLNFQPDEVSGKRTFSIEIDDNNISQVLKSIRDLLKNQDFAEAKAEQFQSLTTRELEVFKLYNTGQNLKSISEHLFISELTARTHWKNIKKKLQIVNNQDVNDYFNAFLK